jgi:outer membrane protein assembly factor BamD (BamD/ComL family)
LVTLLAAAALSCASKPVVIPDDLTVAELIQRGQEASDRNRYAVSLQYYETVIDRFPLDIDSICAAEYEIAFIHYKQKKYDIAKIEFTDLLERYNTPDEVLLPQQFKILSEKILSKVNEQESRRKSAEEESVEPAAPVSTATE